MLTFTYITIFALSFFLLFSDKASISLRQIFLIFCITFYVVAGWTQVQYGFEIAPLYQDLRTNDFINANWIIIFSIVLYDFIYKNSYTSMHTKGILIDHVYSAKKIQMFLVLAMVVFYLSWLNRFSIINIVLRGGDGSRVELSKTTGLLLNSIHFVMLTILFRYSISDGKKRTIKYILQLIFFLFCFPTSMSRLRLLPLYLPLILLYFPVFTRVKLLFAFALFAGICFVFPVLTLTRFQQSNFKEFLESITYSFIGSFDSLDFDSYKTFVYVLSKDIVTYGHQLMGSVFFWVPRVLWPGKPEGSGHYISQLYDLGLGEFSNISMNFLGEGYINFGFLGVVIFVAFLAYASAKFDFYFWEVKKGNIKDPIALYYFTTIGYLFFLLRGDMLSGTAYYCGMVIYIFVTDYICFHRTSSQVVQNDSTDLADKVEPSSHAVE